MVADSGCAPPPVRFSTLALPPRAPARIERDCNVAANVADIWNTAPRREPFLDLVLDDLANRRQRLLLVPPMLCPIPLVLRAQGCRVGPRSVPVIAVPACFLLPGLFRRAQRDGRPPHRLLAKSQLDPAVVHLDLNQVAVAHI